MKRNLYATAIHTATGAFVAIVKFDAAGNQYLVSFGNGAPHSWIPAAALSGFVL